jgi:hypothetical protein
MGTRVSADTSKRNRPDAPSADGDVDSGASIILDFFLVGLDLKLRRKLGAENAREKSNSLAFN